MEFELWHIWILGSIIFFLLEIFVPSFLMASIGIGCLLAFLGAVFGGPFALQVILFIIGVLAGFLGIKPFMTKYVYSIRSVETNAGGLIGRIGKVTEEINPQKGTGSVGIDGDTWKAVSGTGGIIPVGEKVRVTMIESIVLTVESLQGKVTGSGNQESVYRDESKRLIMKVGSKTFFLGFDEILLVYSTHKVTYVFTKAGREYIHDDSLDKLDELLPGSQFFRANRQFIITRQAISEYKQASNGKIEVKFSVNNNFPECISVSRLRAAAFREWMK